MVKRDGVILEKNPSLRVREDWWVFEKTSLLQKKEGSCFERILMAREGRG